MRLALRLAARGRGMTGTNPMVGAVIVAPGGRIIGSGWHRRYGEGHAEVNAVASVSDADRHLLAQSTMYVTLEPCSHYGKTPPCARLLVDTGIAKVVVGAGDPNPKVSGRGLAILREAGVEVAAGVLARESEMLNHVFFTAQRQHRPFVYMKWAQSADGFMDIRRSPGQAPARFSNAVTSLLTMKLRSEVGAVVTTAATAIADGARLTLRGWDGTSPMRVVVDRSRRLTGAEPVLGADTVVSDGRCAPGEFFAGLFEAHGVTSVLVEAGPTYLSALLETGTWDALRVETAPFALGAAGTAPAPALPPAEVCGRRSFGGNEVVWFSNNPLFGGFD